MRVRPDVSVVVIAYNDARRLPRAVASTLAQSLRSVETVIVDDASTDRTGDVAERLAAAHPGRVRAVRLPVNSGGCGRPRNTGVERSDGRFVMFLDSDDLLDRHACLNLVSAGEETGADLVSGLCTRVFLNRPPDAKNRTRPWYPWLYERSAVYGSLSENPDLLYDTLSTNKAYRREFLDEHGLRFVERLHYEDLLFTAEAYLAARRTALIPHRVYNWLVKDAAAGLSISNRRAELANFADRLEIHRRIDMLFALRGAHGLKRAKDVKFLNHDLLLYLRELRGRDPGHRARFLDLAAGYVAELDPRAFEDANPMAAAAAYLIREGDHAAALAAAEHRPDHPVLGAPLAERDGRIYWGARPPRGGLGRRVLDVTGFGFHLRPLRELCPGNTVTRLEVRDGCARIAGHVLNPLGRVPPDADLSAVLVFRDRRGRAPAARVGADVEHRGDRLVWRAEFDPRRCVRPIGFVDRLWDVRLRVTVNGETMVTRPGSGTGSPPLNDVDLPVRPRLTRLAGDVLRSHVTAAGHLSFVLDGRGRGARFAGAVVRGAAGTPAGRNSWRRARRLHRSARRALTSRRTKTAVFNRVLTRLPVRPGLAVFESHLGRSYSDNPKYIYRELRRSGLAVDAVWSYRSSPKGFPPDARLVRRGSWAYYRALARARFWVDNQGFPDGLRKRPETTYIQTWHGSAVKLMGLDQPRLKGGPAGGRHRLRRMVERYDCFLVRSEHDVRTLCPALGVRAEALPAGYPRNDPLVRGADADPETAAEVAGLRRELGLEGDRRRVLLYAPTFATGPRGRPVRTLEPPIDPDVFARELGEQFVLLLRPHYLCRAGLPPSARAYMRDVGDVPDVTPLLLLADALITDRSSIMFDYALLDRPIVLHLPDVPPGQGGDPGGGYVDLERDAPGPIARTADELVAALADLDAAEAVHAPRRRAFAARFGEHDRGTAARTVVERYFADRGRAC
ncbi:bifunctional glycosyltransferase/CDP-glycerol:glycerophosphate glycerophosphotransferase [Actinomadura sp. WAC 06369]|uniref:bifunctional glycosyltransferase/CDP-glycerol:glycerophosphate glycerophosphotransferase n=1 Tax=Actinomadura sp. WAC 06369 TaxID=2203193 RepID=UPI000F791087|nr:CDP-glycerol glycerophosphotransferase family protein [Actinomadura sp. WAC 06369]RSN71329.1 CDP-glycerol--glycerophosphate glycerophosphotransferase [Actinomadura sp. WAC 06369]